MPKTAIMFGSIGAVMETSDVQRRAYNQALRETGVAWQWSVATYTALLTQSGGKERLERLSSATGARLTPAQIDGIHARKTAIACAEMVERRLRPRPGVVELIALAKARRLRLAFVTTTYQANIDAVFAAASDVLTPADFDHVGSRDTVAAGKPAPDAYLAALGALGVAAADALAIEDTAVSVMAAKRAGLRVVATPGALTGSQDFWQADLVVEALAQADGALDPRVVAMLG